MGYLIFVVLLLASRRLRKRTSRGERERFVARAKFAQLTRLIEELDNRDHFEVVPPLDRALVRSFDRRNFLADLVLPLWLLLGYLIIRVFDEPRWAVALGLAVYLTVAVAVTPYRPRSRVTDPLVANARRLSGCSSALALPFARPSRGQAFGWPTAA